MPESNQIPRKRMRFSSSSPSEILRISKSQNQRDRSGRIAPSPSHTGNRFRVHNSPSLSWKMDSRIIRTFPRASIKDLRLRRVFSPSSLSSDWEYNAKAENRNKEQDVELPCDSGISNIAKQGIKIDAGGLGTSGEDGVAEDSLQTTPPDPELLSRAPISSLNEAERICEEINRPAVDKSGTNPCSKSVLHPCSRAKIFKNHGSFSYKRLLPYLMQAAQEKTSSGHCSQPNINLSCNKETEETTDAGAEDPKEEVAELMMTGKSQLPETKPVSQSLDRVVDKHSAGSLCGSTSPLKRVIASSPNNKSVCSRRRLFKTPGSVNYRRMLPYLRELQQDSPCVAETSTNHPDNQNNTEENGVTSNVATESDTCSNEKEKPLPCEGVSASSERFDPENEEPLPCEGVSVSPERFDPEKEQETQVKHVIPDTEKNLGTPHSVLGCEVSLSSSPLVDSRSSTEAATSALNNTSVDNVLGEENMYSAEETEAKNSSEQVDANSLNSTAELHDPYVVVLGTPPSKGILKRRGCRGICSCLNCSSFRLNAERAFEFSRNQLQDTEVMVLDLVGEISHLRDMLEKYESADPNDIYKSQAGEARKRASEAAELAKSRLQQMNEELQVHCRIPSEQRARVKFAHYVHEKTILKASEPGKSIPTSP